MVTDIEGFFQDYARVSTGDSPEALTRFYDQSFLAAGPNGAAAFKNDADFEAWLKQVHAFNEEAGLTSMEVAGVSTATMGEYYLNAEVEWAARFRSAPEPIHFKITYVLRLTEDGPKIIAYISHEDQEEAMRAHGLL